MSPGKIDKRGPQLCGNNKKEGPSTNISIHSVAIYQFDRTARGGFSSVIDLQNTSAPACCDIGDTALIRQTINYLHSHKQFDISGKAQWS
jgi:hypothetical protein